MHLWSILLPGLLASASLHHKEEQGSNIQKGEIEISIPRKERIASMINTLQTLVPVAKNLQSFNDIGRIDTMIEQLSKLPEREHDKYDELKVEGFEKVVKLYKQILEIESKKKTDDAQGKKNKTKKPNLEIHDDWQRIKKHWQNLYDKVVKDAFDGVDDLANDIAQKIGWLQPEDKAVPLKPKESKKPKIKAKDTKDKGEDKKSKSDEVPLGEKNKPKSENKKPKGDDKKSTSEKKKH